MKNITIKKEPDNRGRNELVEQLRSIWLAVSFWNITIAKDNEVNVKDVWGLLEGDMDGKAR